MMKHAANSELFETSVHQIAPLADRLRPNQVENIVGQDHILGVDGTLSRLLKSGNMVSLLLWGPPGCGKTTLAKALATASGYEMATLSVVTSGVADLKAAFEKAKIRRKDGKRTVLFVDEIHRFNRAQQDAFLPFVEDGTVTLIGATTENPSFELNAALLSRCKLIILKRLDESALEKLLQRAESLHQKKLHLTDYARQTLILMADGDGRTLLNMADEIFLHQDANSDSLAKDLDEQALATFIGHRAPIYDKKQEGHYNLISALHKAVRGSDVQAALYWFARMMDGGEDPLYLARRLVRMAVEDIGMADPNALPHCMAAQQCYSFLGSPEGDLALSQAVIYLATAPKSNAAYVGYKSAQRDAKSNGSLMPPAHILNAPTSMMKSIGYGKGYQYDPDAPDGFSGQNYFPEEMQRQEYYQPIERGFERDISKRLAYWAQLRKQRNAT